MNLGLLGCDDVPERFRHLGGTYREMFEALLGPYVPGLRLTWFDVHQGELPPISRRLRRLALHRLALFGLRES